MDKLVVVGRYTERLAESGIEASVGSTWGSYDNTAAEALNKLYKELIWRREPWHGLDDVELAGPSRRRRNTNPVHVAT